MTREQFERLVAEAVALIPRRFRREMRNLALVVEEEPSPALLDEMEIEPPDSLFGLYQGIPLPERSWGHGNHLPDKITLFQRPIEEDCEDEDHEKRGDHSDDPRPPALCCRRDVVRGIRRRTGRSGRRDHWTAPRGR